MLFNIIQNAVKYNKQNGFILIIFRSTVIPKNKKHEGRKYSFETEVIDTGIGISKER